MNKRSLHTAASKLRKCRRTKQRDDPGFLHDARQPATCRHTIDARQQIDAHRQGRER